MSVMSVLNPLIEYFMYMGMIDFSASKAPRLKVPMCDPFDVKPSANINSGDSTPSFSTFSYRSMIKSSAFFLSASLFALGMKRAPNALRVFPAIGQSMKPASAVGHKSKKL